MKKIYRLVHGTSTRYLPSILKDGLQPRGERDSAWALCPSNSKMVYLSAAYALHYAMNATENDEDCLLVEVAVNIERLYPDEDFVAQAVPPGHSLYDAHPSLINRTRAAIAYVENLTDQKMLLDTYAVPSPLPVSV